MTLVSQYKRLVDFELGAKFDSYMHADIRTDSSKYHTGFSSSGSDVIISMHCCGNSASQVGEFIQTSIHSDVRLSVYWFVYSICLFSADCVKIVSWS